MLCCHEEFGSPGHRSVPPLPGPKQALLYRNNSINSQLGATITVDTSTCRYIDRGCQVYEIWWRTGTLCVVMLSSVVCGMSAGLHAACCHYMSRCANCNV